MRSYPIGIENLYVWHKRNRLNMISVDNVYNTVSGTTALDVYFTNGMIPW